MTILTAGSGCAKLIFLPMRFCAPFLFTFYYYLRMLWCTYAHKTIYYTIQLTFFLHKPTYSCYKLQIPKLWTIDIKLTNYWYKTYELLIQNLRTIDTKLTNYWYKTYELLIQNLRTIDTKLTNYWYKTHELLIQNLRTIDTKLTNYWYKTYELLILNLRTTNPFCYKLQILKLQKPILFVSVDKIKRSQVMLGER